MWHIPGDRGRSTRARNCAHNCAATHGQSEGKTAITFSATEHRRTVAVCRLLRVVYLNYSSIWVDLRKARVDEFECSKL